MLQHRFGVISLFLLLPLPALCGSLSSDQSAQSAGAAAFVLARGAIGEEPSSETQTSLSSEIAGTQSADKLARGQLSPPEQALVVERPLTTIGTVLAVSALAATLDHEGERFGRLHGGHGLAKGLAKAGSALPLLAFGVAGFGLVAIDDTRFQRTSLSALEAGGGSAIASLGLKYAIGRSRPENGIGPDDFHPFKGRNGNSSLPSVHSAAIWGTLTPYAKEYDLPWLYGLALLTNYGRIAERKHWVSDTVAGAAIGYLAGDFAWHWNRQQDETAPRIGLGARSVSLRWSFW